MRGLSEAALTMSAGAVVLTQGEQRRKEGGIVQLTRPPASQEPSKTKKFGQYMRVTDFPWRQEGSNPQHISRIEWQRAHQSLEIEAEDEAGSEEKMRRIGNDAADALAKTAAKEARERDGVQAVDLGVFHKVCKSMGLDVGGAAPLAKAFADDGEESVVGYKPATPASALLVFPAGFVEMRGLSGEDLRTSAFGNLQKLRLQGGDSRRTRPVREKARTPGIGVKPGR